MKQHTATVDIPVRPLGRADVKIKIKKNGAVYGTLAISNGSVVWWPKSTSYGWKMGWKKFHQTMTDEATKFEKRRRSKRR